MTKRIAPLLLVVLLTGCVEVEETYIINPDGSGKVHRTVTLPPVSGVMNDLPEHPDQVVQDLVRRNIEQARGVDAWKNISYSVREDGWITMEATAYFSDINELVLRNNNFSTATSGFHYEQSGDDQFTFRIKQTDNDQDEDEDPQKKNPDFSDAELDKKIKLELARLRYARQVYSPLKNATVHSEFQLPGNVQSSKNLKNISDSAVVRDFSGTEILREIDELVNNRKKVREYIRRDLNLAEMIFNRQTVNGEGSRKNPREKTVTGTLGKPQFNYEKEVREARRSSSDTLKKLGVDMEEDETEEDENNSDDSDIELTAKDVKTGKDAEQVTLENLRLTRLMMNYEKTENRRKVMRLSLDGTLSHPITNVEQLTIHDVVTNTGESLLEDDRRLDYMRQGLNDDGQDLHFTIEVDLPRKKASRISSLRGTLKYNRSVGEKSVPLDFGTLEHGAEAERFGAKIEEIERKKGQTTKYNISLDLKPSAIETVTFLDGKGNPVAPEDKHISQHDHHSIIYLELDERLPKDGSIVLKHNLQSRTYELPIELNETPLLFPEQK